MFNEKDILARLQNGEDVQKIADEMAAALNQANKVYADQKAAEEAARKAEEAKMNDRQKKDDLQDVLDAFHVWLDTYYKIEDLDTIFNELNADAVLELIAALEEYAKAMKGLEQMFSMKNAPKIIKSNTKPKNADEQINDFLKKMGW